MLTTQMTRVNCRDIPAQLVINDLGRLVRMRAPDSLQADKGLSIEYRIHPSGCPDGIQNGLIRYSGCKRWMPVIRTSSPDERIQNKNLNGAYGVEWWGWKYTVTFSPRLGHVTLDVGLLVPE